MFNKKIVFALIAALIIFQVHGVLAENTKTAYTAMRMYGLSSNYETKVFTVVAANYLNAMTITVTLSSPRFLSAEPPYLVTVQPGQTTVTYSPVNLKGRQTLTCYLNGIETDGTVIFFTDHEISWTWEKKNNVKTLTIETTSIGNFGMVIVGHYNSWGTTATVTLFAPYPGGKTSTVWSGTTFYYASIKGLPGIITVKTAIVPPATFILWPAPMNYAYRAIVVGGSANFNEITYTMKLVDWNTTRKTTLVLPNETQAHEVAFGGATFFMGQTMEPFNPVTYFPTIVIVSDNSYQVIMPTTYAFLGGDSGGIKYLGFINNTEKLYWGSNHNGVTVYYSDGKVTITSGGRIVYSDGAGDYESLICDQQVEYFVKGPFTVYAISSITFSVKNFTDIVEIDFGKEVFGAPSFVTSTVYHYFMKAYPDTTVSIFYALGGMTTDYNEPTIIFNDGKKMHFTLPASVFFAGYQLNVKTRTLFINSIGYSNTVSTNSCVTFSTMHVKSGVTTIIYNVPAFADTLSATRSKCYNTNIIPTAYEVSVVLYVRPEIPEKYSAVLLGKYISANPTKYYLYSVTPHIVIHNNIDRDTLVKVDAPHAKICSNYYKLVAAMLALMSALILVVTILLAIHKKE